MAARKEAAAATAVVGQLPSFQSMENLAIAWAGVEAGSSKSQSTTEYCEGLLPDSFPAHLTNFKSAPMSEGVPPNFFLVGDDSKKHGSAPWTIDVCIKHRVQRSTSMLCSGTRVGGGHHLSQPTRSIMSSQSGLQMLHCQHKKVSSKR